MIGAIVGDIVGSIYEFNNIKTKNFDFFHESCFFTDDTVMTIAVGKALQDAQGHYENLSDLVKESILHLGHMYPDAGYGHRFFRWLFSDKHEPYNSFGNGAAMRVSACGIVGRNINEVKELSRKVTDLTHNHPEGIKGAEATSIAIYLAKNGKTKEEIREYISKHYYPLDFTLDEIRKTYSFDGSSQGTVPEALEAFLESGGYEDAIRNAISIGGDSDTMAAITGSIAGAFYGIPHDISIRARKYLDGFLKSLLTEFENEYPPKIAGNKT